MRKRGFSRPFCEGFTFAASQRLFKVSIRSSHTPTSSSVVSRIRRYYRFNNAVIFKTNTRARVGLTRAIVCNSIVCRPLETCCLVRLHLDFVAFTPWKRYNGVFSLFFFFFATHWPVSTRHRDCRSKRTKSVETIAIFDFSAEIDRPLDFPPDDSSPLFDV